MLAHDAKQLMRLRQKQQQQQQEQQQQQSKQVLFQLHCSPLFGGGGASAPCRLEEGKPCLFNVTEDPCEVNDLSADPR
jgi:hypothetical protein